MMPDRYVTKHPRGWAVKAPSGKRASSVHKTQREAERAAKRTVGTRRRRGTYPGPQWPMAGLRHGTARERSQPAT